MTLDAWLSSWLSTFVAPIRAANTVSSYRFALAHLPPELLASELEQLQPLDLQRAINLLAARFPRQAQILYAALHAAFRRAVLFGLLDRSPMERVEKPPHRKKQIFFLSADELAALLRCAAALPSFRAFCLMGLLGLRRGEALAVRAEDFRSGFLTVERQRMPDGSIKPLKSAASFRRLPVPPELLSMLSNPPSGIICPVTCSRLAADLRAACAAADVPQITPHGLRHTYATLGLHAGVSMRVLQAALGHAHFDLTANTYVHVLADDLTSANASISALCVGQFYAQQLRAF